MHPVIDLRLWRICAARRAPVALIVAMFSLEEVPAAARARRCRPTPSTATPRVALAKELAERRLRAPAGVRGGRRARRAGQGPVRGDRRRDRLRAALRRQLRRRGRRAAEPDRGPPGPVRAAGGADRPPRRRRRAAARRPASPRPPRCSRSPSGFTGLHPPRRRWSSSPPTAAASARSARGGSSRDYSDTEPARRARSCSASPPRPSRLAPLVIPWSTGPQSTGDASSPRPRTPQSPRRPACPPATRARSTTSSGSRSPPALGEQGPLVEAGLDAVRLSLLGRAAARARRATRSTSVDPSSLDDFGRAALSLMLALDAAAERRSSTGPDAYIGLAGNLLPGWTLALLALALLLAGGGRRRRPDSRPPPAARSRPRAALRLGRAARGAVPGRRSLLVYRLRAGRADARARSSRSTHRRRSSGTGGTIGGRGRRRRLGAVAFFLRPLLPPPRRDAAAAAPPPSLLAALAAFGIWLVNPYLALLVALGLQLWVLAAARRRSGRLAAAGLVLAGLLPLLAALVDLAGRFEPASASGDLLLMLTGGQLGDGLALLGCAPGGGRGVAIVAGAPGPGRRRRDARSRPRTERRAGAAAAGARSAGGAARARGAAGGARARAEPQPEPRRPAHVVEAGGLELARRPAVARPTPSPSLTSPISVRLGAGLVATACRASSSRSAGRRGKQLVVLAARERPARGPPLGLPRRRRRPSASGTRLELDLERHAAGLGDVAGVGAEPVADVDHRRGARRRRARARRQARPRDRAGARAAPRGVARRGRLPPRPAVEQRQRRRRRPPELAGDGHDVAGGRAARG